MLHNNINYLKNLSWFSDNYWWILLILIIITTLAIVFLSPKKQQVEELDEDLLNKVVTYFGGYDNLTKAIKDGARIKISVKDLEKCQLEEIKNLGATGIFVTGNLIKLMLPFPSDRIIDEINQRKTED